MSVHEYDASERSAHRHGTALSQFSESGPLVKPTRRLGRCAVPRRPRFLSLPAELRLRIYTYMLPHRNYPFSSRPEHAGLRSTCHQIQVEFDDEALKQVSIAYPFELPRPYPIVEFPQCTATLSTLQVTIPGHWIHAKSFLSHVFRGPSIPWIRTLEITFDAAGNYDPESLRKACGDMLIYLLAPLINPTHNRLSAAQETRMLVVRFEAGALAAATWLELHGASVQHATLTERAVGKQRRIFAMPSWEVDEDGGWLQATWTKRGGRVIKRSKDKVKNLRIQEVAKTESSDVTKRVQCWRDLRGSFALLVIGFSCVQVSLWLWRSYHASDRTSIQLL